MIVRRLWLTDFRNYTAADITFSPGCTAVLGSNGQGKTNLVEALSMLATLSSFRGVTNEALVRVGSDLAIVRAEVQHDDGREVLIEAELPRRGRHKVQVNRQRLARTSDLLGALRVTVFSPDDLILVKGSPGERRSFMDDTAVAVTPSLGTVVADLDRILRQRGALLKQIGGRLSADTELTLEVWDAKLAEVGESLGKARAQLVERLDPLVHAAYQTLAVRFGQSTGDVTLTYEPSWRDGGLAQALTAARTEDLRRQVTSVGPHRDDLDIVLNGLPARTHASQGEQRTLALALKLAGHQLVTSEHGESPVLILDDVFSELDPERSSALLANLPPGQILVTSASGLPPAATPERILQVTGGTISEPDSKPDIEPDIESSTTPGSEAS